MDRQTHKDAAARSAAGTPRARALQYLGGAIIGLVILTGLLGSTLMAQPTFAPVELVLHIVGAVALMGASAHALRVSLRVGGRRRQGPAALALAAAIGATIAGVAFLLDGQAASALHWMEGLTGTIALAGVLLILLGGARSHGKVPAPVPPAAALAGEATTFDTSD